MANTKTSVKRFNNNKTKKLNEKMEKRINISEDIKQQKNTINLKLDKMKNRLEKNKNKLKNLKQTNKDLENTIRKMTLKAEKLTIESDILEQKLRELQH